MKILLKNARIYDGTGAADQMGDVLVDNDCICFSMGMVPHSWNTMGIPSGVMVTTSSCRRLLSLAV